LAVVNVFLDEAAEDPLIVLDIADIVAYYATLIAGWSSPVARRAHNPKVVGSNPAPATNQLKGFQHMLEPLFRSREAKKTLHFLCPCHSR
jgi:hypothetical protein